MAGNKGHTERKHSKFSASGAERWMQCPGSVALSEGLPDTSSPWAEEGTRAHEVLEALMLSTLKGAPLPKDICERPQEMLSHGRHAADFILGVARRYESPEILVESRVHLDFIHPEMFGTFDGAIVEHFGTLHVFDYKYGAGHAVSPKENLQMIFYGIGLAHRYHWNFQAVRLWIVQPRIRGYVAPVYWDLTIEELKSYVSKFKEEVDNVIRNPEVYKEGGHCHWCKAKGVCPLKYDSRTEDVQDFFQKRTKHGRI